MLARLARLKPAEAVVGGAALGVGGPKRLGLTLLAATTISAAAIRSSEKVGLAATFVMLASVVVWVPAALCLSAGTSGLDSLVRAQEWMTTHRGTLTFSLLLGLGGVLTAQGLASLR